MISQLKPWLQALVYELLQALGHLCKATRLMHLLTEFNNALKQNHPCPLPCLPSLLSRSLQYHRTLSLTLEFQELKKHAQN